VSERFRAGRAFATEQLAGHSHAVESIPQIANAMRNFGPVTVPADQYFMMGDSRDNSQDSRYFGFVPVETVVGRSSAVAILAGSRAVVCAAVGAVGDGVEVRH
jgi:signal peptidase I